MQDVDPNDTALWDGSKYLPVHRCYEPVIAIPGVINGCSIHQIHTDLWLFFLAHCILPPVFLSLFHSDLAQQLFLPYGHIFGEIIAAKSGRKLGFHGSVVL